MRKKLCFLMCVVLFCCVANGATPIDDPSYNLSFELHWPDACGVVTQIYGHTGIDEYPPTPDPCDPNQGVWNWLSTGQGFQGVDVFCLYAIDSPTHCHPFPATDGICFVYLQHQDFGIYQVLDGNDANAVITAGRQYTMKFDAMDHGTGGVRGEFYSESVETIANELFILPETWQDEENCYTGDTTLGANCVDFHRDLEVSFIALGYEDFIGETLSVRIEAPDGKDYAFIDNVRLEWRWLTVGYNPIPEDGAIDVAQDRALGWSHGLWTQAVDSHEIYFGTSWSDVNDADRFDVSGVYRGVQNRDVNYYAPDEIPYELGKTYYWRVDEVNTAFVGPPAAAPDAEGRWKGDIWSFEVTGFATNPSPEDGATDESLFAILSWTPGTSSETHDVYLGTDFNDVNEADNGDLDIFKGNQLYGANSYDPGMLDLKQTYYWRIDEWRNSHTDVIKGKMWSFTVAEYMMIDDMESYESSTTIDDTWVEAGRAAVLLQTAAGDANYTMDYQSMKYYFQNNFSPYYSKTTRTFSSPQNWTLSGFKVLTLYFRANFDNLPGAVQPMYVFVSDGVDTGTVEYDDPNDLVRGWVGWQEWNIDLQDFADAGVELDNITEIGITIGAGGSAAGVGYVYFDDIRLYPTRCVVEEASGSFTDDCMVDMVDFAVLARDWLISEIGNVTATTAPSDANLYGHWAMNDNTTTSVVLDSSVNLNHGVLYDRATGSAVYEGDTDDHSVLGVDDRALKFDGEDDYVVIPTMDVSSNTITIAAWVKRESGSHIYEGIVMSSNSYVPDGPANDPNYTAGLQLGADTENWEVNNELSYMWTGYSWNWHSGLFVHSEEWTFTALTVAPDVATLYLYDGTFLQAARNYDTHEALPWNTVIHIADQMQFGPPQEETERFFTGAIDDVYFYNRTLSPEEILYLALQGPGDWYLPLEPWRADADDNEQVDGMDLGIMCDNWLTEVLWP